MAFSYLDNNAGSALAPGVLDAMLPYLEQQQGNPSSSHRFGRYTQLALDTARQQVADLVKVQPKQIIFTAGGTEANNQALMGIESKFDSGTILIGATEHPAMLEPAKRLAERGFEVKLIPVDNNGLININEFAAMLNDEVRLVSVMWANNETGVIQDIAALSALTGERNIPFVCDAVQAAGKIAIDFAALDVQMMTLSAHKFGGPKGIGALITAPNFEWPAYVLGGGQESGMRSGTENVAAIVGFGAAAAYVQQHLDDYQQHCLALRQQLEQQLRQTPGTTIFAESVERLPNTVFFSLQGFDADTLLMALDRQGIAVSSGSACGTGRQTPSHVLTAMGVEATTALGAIRVSVGTQTTAEQIDQLVAALKQEAERFNHLMNR